AADGPTGLRLAHEIRPDVITLDVLMPGQDGWAVLTALKGEPDLAGIPVIMLTILDEPQLGFSLGASEYLTKPIDRARLRSVLQTYLAGRPAGPILVVEDHAETRSLLRRALEQEGWAVAEAENGRRALARVAEATPALVLLDLMMPEMDGFEFLEALRARAPWRSIPVVILTAKDLTDDDRRRLNGGVERIVRKGDRGRDSLLGEVRDLVAARLARARA
ncbi:MAG: response regulator, partial [Gemmatimonadota bacterium]|nr:response regulator [Gemmatimonadota bacterium]